MDVKLRDGTVATVEDSQLYEFPEGLFGFEDFKKYAMVSSEYAPFIWMQSLENEHLAFLIVDPFLVCDDYEVDIDEKTLSKIGITSPKDVCVMSVVTIPANGNPITANLQGPLIINRKTNQSMQVILNDNKWTTKFNIVQALKNREAVC